MLYSVKIVLSGIFTKKKLLCQETIEEGDQCILKFVPYFYNKNLLEGSVQRKLRWVKNGVNRSVGASDCGAGHSFVVLFRFHLGFALFPFAVCTVKIIGEF